MSPSFIDGRSALATLLWTLGVLLLLCCTAQYGPLFHGPAGWCVPVGLPLIFGIAWFVWREEGEEVVEEDETPSSDVS